MDISDIPKVNSILKKDFEKNKAPVVDMIHSKTRDPFKVLVATILSARTRDETTTEVTTRLFNKVKNLNDLKRVPEKQLEKIIFPIGFYRTKARHLKQLPLYVDKLFNGSIPDNIDDLCKLPGVGRKTANLVVAIAFDKHGICVDVHVHRICNRLGLIDTRTPFETEMKLREILPKRYWKKWNSQLVSYGQRICTPRNPGCDTCKIRKYCAREGVF